MPYVAVPKDLFAIKTKFMFNLTKRQVYCFAGGGVCGLATHLFLKDYDLGSLSSLCIMLSSAPFFILAMFEKNGKTLDVILKYVLTQKFLVSAERPYKTQNIYTLLETQNKINKELALIGTKNTNEKTKTSNAKVDKRRKTTS